VSGVAEKVTGVVESGAGRWGIVLMDGRALEDLVLGGFSGDEAVLLVPSMGRRLRVCVRVEAEPAEYCVAEEPARVPTLGEMALVFYELGLRVMGGRGGRKERGQG
jgi:hypothetical protein